jgi:hypothetical protein
VAAKKNAFSNLVFPELNLSGDLLIG